MNIDQCQKSQTTTCTEGQTPTKGGIRCLGWLIAYFSSRWKFFTHTVSSPAVPWSLKAVPMRALYRVNTCRDTGPLLNAKRFAREQSPPIFTFKVWHGHDTSGNQTHNHQATKRMFYHWTNAISRFLRAVSIPCWQVTLAVGLKP